MFRLSPRRNQRNKGFKVKHALQICLLLGVCIWLLYQVQNSNNKKAASNESTNVSGKVQAGNDPIQLGRKDLRLRVEGTIEDDRHKEEQEEEEESRLDEHEQNQEKAEEGEHGIVLAGKEKDMKEENTDESKEGVDSKERESEEESEESKRDEGEEKEIKEEETEESKAEGSEENQEKENVEKEGDEKDSTDEKGKSNEKGSNGTELEEENRERKDTESKEKGSAEEMEIKEEDKIGSQGLENEEKVREEAKKRDTEEKEKEDDKKEKESKIENSGSSENKVHDGSDSNNEGGGEVNQKGENAPSELAQDSQSLIESEKGSTENSNGEKQFKNKQQHDFKGNSTVNTEPTKVNQNEPTSNVTENEMIEKNDPSNVMSNEGKGNESILLEARNSSNPGTTGTLGSGEQQKETDNSESFVGGSPQGPQTTAQNTVQSISNSTENQNGTVDNNVPKGDSIQENSVKADTMPGDGKTDWTSPPPASTENKDLTSGEYVHSSKKIESVVLSGQNANSNTSAGTEGGSKNSTRNQKNDVEQSKSDSNSGPGAEEKKNDGTDLGKNKSVDFSDSLISQDEKGASSNTNDSSNADLHGEGESSNSSIPREETDARTDLGTLPETGVEGMKNEDAVAK